MFAPYLGNVRFSLSTQNFFRKCYRYRARKTPDVLKFRTNTKKNIDLLFIYYHFGKNYLFFTNDENKSVFYRNCGNDDVDV